MLTINLESDSCEYEQAQEIMNSLKLLLENNPQLSLSVVGGSFVEQLTNEE